MLIKSLLIQLITKLQVTGKQLFPVFNIKKLVHFENCLILSYVVIKGLSHFCPTIALQSTVKKDPY